MLVPQLSSFLSVLQCLDGMQLLWVVQLQCKATVNKTACCHSVQRLWPLKHRQNSVSMQPVGRSNWQGKPTARRLTLAAADAMSQQQILVRRFASRYATDEGTVQTLSEQLPYAHHCSNHAHQAMQQAVLLLNCCCQHHNNVHCWAGMTTVTL